MNAYDCVLPDGLADVLRVEVAVGTIGRTQKTSVLVNRVVCNGQQRRDRQTIRLSDPRSVTERTEQEREREREKVALRWNKAGVLTALAVRLQVEHPPDDVLPGAV